MGMMTKFLTAGALAAAMAAGAAQAATVNISGAPDTTNAVNDFADELFAALGAGYKLLTFASITTNGPVRLTFTAVGAESGFDNSFFATGAGVGVLNETGDFGEGTNLLTSAGQGSITGTFSGLIDGLLKFTNNRDSAPITTVNLGAPEFGIFVNSLGAGDHSTFFFAFDDDGANKDDNHDDFLVRVNVAAVPVPAAGFLLFGALGGLAMLRRRKTA